MITRICFVRHGETDWNREGRYQGSRDIPLNDHGRGQAGTEQGLVDGSITSTAPSTTLAQSLYLIAHGRVKMNRSLRRP